MSKTTKSKISLTPPATFTAPVDLQLPGGGVGTVMLTFKHRTKSSIKELIQSFTPAKDATDEEVAAFEGPKDVEIILDIACGWDLDEEFNAKSLDRMTEAYAGSAQAVINTYLAELSGARVKN